MDQLRAYRPEAGDYGLDRPGSHDPVRNPLDLLSRLYMGLSSSAPGVTQTGAPKPKIAAPDMLREISMVMNRLLKGNMPPKEADPNIIRQLGTKQQADGTAIQYVDGNSDGWRLGVGSNPLEIYSRRVPGYVTEHPQGMPGLSTTAERTYHDPIMTLKSEQWIPDEWFKQGPGNIKRQVPMQRMQRYLDGLKEQGLWP